MTDRRCWTRPNRLDFLLPMWKQHFFCRSRRFNLLYASETSSVSLQVIAKQSLFSIFQETPRKNEVRCHPCTCRFGFGFRPSLSNGPLIGCRPRNQGMVPFRNTDAVHLRYRYSFVSNIFLNFNNSFGQRQTG